jgi:hypothetical protein
VGTLRFPRLGGGCTVDQSPKACYSSTNDLNGLAAHALSIDNSQGYALFGNALTLGAGGMKAAPSTNQCPCGFAGTFLPIILGAAQAWSIGRPQMAIEGKVTGQGHALHIDLVGHTSVNLADVEAGAVSIIGTNIQKSSTPPGVLLEGHGSQVSELNGVNGNPVRVTRIFFRAARATVGSLTADHAVLSATGAAPPGKLSVNGSVVLDSASEVLVYVSHSGASAGKDYWQLAASGPVDLGGASLVLSVSTSKGFGPDQPCPKLKAGTVETLITTKGSLKGRFAGVRDKAKVPITCARKTKPMVQIRYKKHAVTATVL